MKFKISEIAQVVGGGTPSTKEEDNYANSDVAWITPKDLSGYTQKYIANGSRDISEKGLNSSSAKLMPKGTVLVSSRAPIGYVAIADGPLATNQGFKSLVPNEDVVTSEYLYYVMKQSKSALEQVATGTTFKEVSGSVMKNFEIDIPNLEEQERIVSILAPIDQKIELLQTINDNLAA
ncbi:restriction endonuclease subunit S [Weissella confusa]|uniref:restriction endonuclease subunit S n=1 Tax=Weissella confusa TaxID=1583 RepID=UPI00107F712E|nr:restriction endonuclease subunit S [Weissella confusa]TGE83544.1 restriction endonuclease subunit S [Weissella confusa]